MLPPVLMAAIAHAFEEYCRGGGGGSVDFAALVAPYVFDFHLAMGVRLVGMAPSRFGAWGGGGGGPLESEPGLQRWRWQGLTVGAVVVVQTMVGTMARHCRQFPRLLLQQCVGGGADEDALALSAVPNSPAQCRVGARAFYSALPLLAVPCSLV